MENNKYSLEELDTIFKIYSVDYGWFFENDIREAVTISEAVDIANELKKDCKEVRIEQITIFDFSEQECVR